LLLLFSRFATTLFTFFVYKMSRARRTSGSGTVASSVLALNSIAAKEPAYKEAILRNHMHSKVMAECFFAKESDALEACLKAVSEDQQEDLLEAFQEQRNRLMKVSETNVDNFRQVNAFIGALNQSIRPHIEQQREGTEPQDYEKLILEKMQEYRQAQKDSELDMADEQFVREIKTALGEATASANNDDDDDDDLQVVTRASGETLKCPIMGSYYEDPVKSSICGHTYSRMGIENHLRSSRKCPVAGCSNNNITRDQLQPDIEMQMKVRRQRRKSDQEKAQRLTQDLIDSDEE
jgi:hypothetical protein